MLTVVSDHGHRDVLVEADESTTVGGLAAALADAPRSPTIPSNVVRLPRTRAPYGFDHLERRAVSPRSSRSRASRARPAPVRPDSSSAPLGTLGTSPPSLWLDGRPLDADTPVCGLLRDGDLIALDRRAAGATLTEEPTGVAEVRVVGGPVAGSVHRLGLGDYTIGSDPACALTVPDPAIPGIGAIVRITPTGISIVPPHPPPEGPEIDGRPLPQAAPWRADALLRCGNSLFVCVPIEQPDAHVDPLPDGGLAYTRPPRLAPPDRHQRFQVPVEPKRTEGMRLQLLAATLPAVFGLTMAVVFHQWYFLLIALMTPMIMIGQWVGDRRHGRKKYRRAMKLYRQRLVDFEREIEIGRAADERERRIHDPDTLLLRLGLADL
ncbi:MAG TPA: cell division protein FtsK, partial [Thermopolyspora sp.]